MKSKKKIKNVPQIHESTNYSKKVLSIQEGTKNSRKYQKFERGQEMLSK